MAEVFAAESPAGDPAAVKILHAGVANDPDLLARFWREAQIASDIGHPGVVRVIDHGLADDGRPFLAMERLEGATLADLAKQNGGVGTDALLDYTDQLLEVLAVAHDRSVVHRDLKPANLFITREGRLKVLDFGIARLLEQSTDDLRTATGIALGTIAYMAPEQAAGRRDEIDGRTDLYAVGAILFRLLSGRRVHEGRNGGEMLLMTASRPAPPLASVAPAVPAALAAVVDRALAFDRRERFPDARTMRVALAEARLALRGAPAAVAIHPAAPAEPTVLSAGSVRPALPPEATVLSAGSVRPALPPEAIVPSAGSVAPFTPPPPAIETNTRRIMLVVGAVVLAVSALGFVGTLVLALLYKAEEPPPRQEYVELGKLLGMYRKDEEVAKELYGSELIRTTGTVTTVDARSEDGYVRLGGASEPWLECYLRPMVALTPGSEVTVRGRVTAFHESPKRILLSPCELLR